MKNKTTATILIFGLLIFSLIGSVLLSGQKQDRRGSAYFSGTKISIQPESLTKKVDDKFSVQLYINPKTGAKIDFVESQVCLGEGLDLAENTLKDNLVLDSGFTELVKATKTESGNCISFAIRSEKKQEELPSGTAVKLATLKLKAVKASTGSMTIDKDRSLVSGYNPNANSKDLAIEVTDATGSKYTVASGTGGDDEGDDEEEEEEDEDDNDDAGEGPILSFKTASRKLDKDPKCGKKEKFTITVTNGTNSKTYSNVTANWEGGNYKVSKKLTDFPSTKNAAVFIKGSKSLQVKYGKDSQNSLYNKAGGEIDLTVSKTFNFTGFPLLPGDVTGESNKQDGVINGLDFSFVKTKAAKREETKEGGNLQADLDGNCLVNSMDVTALMLSLEDKMDQLY